MKEGRRMKSEWREWGLWERGIVGRYARVFSFRVSQGKMMGVYMNEALYESPSPMR